MLDGDIPSEAVEARLDEAAPLFEGRSTEGPIRLGDYRRRWVLLFAHPADFTPVCTSEFIALARAEDRFEAMDCALIGLSVDSVYAHLAWIERIEQDSGVRVRFPLIEDPSLVISRAYGMIHPGASSTATVRSVFVIDPDGILRAMVHYPMSVGRSVDELVRLVAALRATRDGKAVAGEGWEEGQALLSPAPTTASDLDKVEGEPWYAGVSS